jgi:hypothetical protein
VVLPADAVAESDWDYAGSGYASEVESAFAAQVRAAIVQNRDDACAALADDPEYQAAKTRRGRARRDAA